MRGYPTLDVIKTSEQSPVWNRYTDPELLLAATTITANSWGTDYGAEIDVRGYTRLIVWSKLVINSSINVRVRALAKHTYAGTDEYVLPIKTISSTSVAVNAHYYEFDTDTNQSMVLDFDVKDVSYIQLQLMAETVGVTGGTLETYITKMY